MTVRIVTDSTCDLPPDLVQALDITVVPAYINVGERSYLDGVDLSRAQFYRELPGYDSHPTTAAPAPGVFADVYQRLAASGGGPIISMHIDGTLSGILNAARLGAESTPDVQVSLFDSGQLSMGLGLLVKLAAEAAANGAGNDEILQLLAGSAEKTHTYAALSTLEFLRRSGRVNWAQFGIATVLSIKPIVHVHQGQINLDRVRTQRRARQYLLDRLEQHAPLRAVAILHTANFGEGETLSQEAIAFCQPGVYPVITEVTPAIGAHVGPGGLGFAGIAAS
jgi:DegV family protein with EDD domain